MQDEKKHYMMKFNDKILCCLFFMYLFFINYMAIKSLSLSIDVLGKTDYPFITSYCLKKIVLQNSSSWFDCKHDTSILHFP